MSYMLCVVSIIFKLEGYPVFACLPCKIGEKKKTKEVGKTKFWRKLIVFISSLSIFNPNNYCLVIFIFFCEMGNTVKM